MRCEAHPRTADGLSKAIVRRGVWRRVLKSAKIGSILISKEILLLAGDSFTDHQFHHDVLGRAQKLGYTSGELLRIELEPKLDLFLSVSPVNVLPKPTEVDDFSADPSPLRVEVSGLDRMVGQRQCMQDARLPRAVGRRST